MCPACLRGIGPLALMKSADRIPFRETGFDALTLPRVVPSAALFPIIITYILPLQS